MKRTILVACTAFSLHAGGVLPFDASNALRSFAGEGAAFTARPVSGPGEIRVNEALLRTPLPPCSTFKIWNSLIAREVGNLTNGKVPFYRWDGVARSFPDWNRDLDFEEAFRASCVPAFQDLARRTGEARMKSWLERIGYGNRDVSSGIDRFWLTTSNARPIRISPLAQRELLEKWRGDRLPFGKDGKALLDPAMFLTNVGGFAVHGKTGSGTDEKGDWALGWYVGFVRALDGEETVFAAVVRGPGLRGKDARDRVLAALRKTP